MNVISNQRAHIRRSLDGTKRRSGVATIWLLASVPLALVALQMVLELGWLHCSRAELQVAVDAAALAGARVWGVSSPDAASDTSILRTAAKLAAQDVLSAHAISGTSVLSGVGDNNAPALVNNNLSCPGTILLGDFASGTFSAGTAPLIADRRACRCDVTITVASPFGLGNRTLTATATASWNTAAMRASLATVTSVSCL